MKLLVQPGDGVLPLIQGITRAKKSIEIAIFRFDQREIERALVNAVSRGVSVKALIAHTNRAGEENLRKLEMRMLGQGITVARTADDLVRYHGKYMIVDRRRLYVLAFNLTLLDIERSRSFGIITENRNLVAEAARLFEADTQRNPYAAENKNLIISPANARRRLGELIKSAKKELLIYDLKVSDQEMIHLLENRVKAGVSVRIIGKLTVKIPDVTVYKLSEMRLHTRAMIVDGHTAFIGSQSLRENELDARREVGLVFKDPKSIEGLTRIFEADWRAAAASSAQRPAADEPLAKVVKRVAKSVIRGLPPVVPVLDGAVKDVVGPKAELELNPAEVENLVKDAVKEAVRDALSGVVEEAVENGVRTNGAA